MSLHSNSSHYNELLKEVLLKDEIYKNGLVTSIIPSMMDRRDGISIFEEGEAFSGVERVGEAESYITIAASPHIQPSISKEKLKKAAESVLKKDVELPPGVGSIETMPAQLLVWWRGTTEDEHTADIPYISTLPSERQDDFSYAISRQASKAVEIISTVSDLPIIWGSWGFASPEERLPTGRGRGAPTNRFGHLHVIDLNSDIAKDYLDTDAPAADKFNHYKAWDSLLFSEFQKPLARALSLSIKSIPIEKVSPFSNTLESPSTGTIGVINNGYTIIFKDYQKLDKVIKSLIDVAGVFEQFYKDTTEAYSYYHKYHGRSEALSIAKRNISLHAKGMGFTEDEATAFTNFILSIRPTYSQLLTWIEDLSTDTGADSEDLKILSKTAQRYRYIRNLLGNRAAKEALSTELVHDTLRDPNDFKSIRNVWPEHASATFIINEYKSTSEGVVVKAINIIPGIESSEGGVNHVTGKILVRST